MTGSFVLDYVLLVFLSSCGVFQVAAAANGIRGLLILPSRSLSITLGLALIAASFTWFFLSEPRNRPDTTVGLNGNQQFGYFFVGIALGLLFTIIASTLRHPVLGDGAAPLPWGLDALHRANYLRCLISAGRQARTFFRVSGPWSRPGSWGAGIRRRRSTGTGRSGTSSGSGEG